MKMIPWVGSRSEKAHFPPLNLFSSLLFSRLSNLFLRNLIHIIYIHPQHAVFFLVFLCVSLFFLNPHMAYSPSLCNKPPLFTLHTVTSTSVFFPPSSVKISFASYPCLRTRQRLPHSYTVPQFRVTCATGIADISETQFSDTVLKADRPVLVEFVANWCGPCRLISPIMEWAAQEYGDRLTVVKIDHDANPKLIEEFKVYGLPTLMLFKNGQEVPESRREGAITKVKLKEHLDALLNSISVT